MKTKTWRSFLIATTTLLSAPLMTMSSVTATSTKISANINSPQSITITREVSGVTNLVTNSFGYSVTADANNPGEVSGLPSEISLEMNAVQPVENVARATSTIDFAEVSFSALGNYKFIVRETSSTNAAVYPVDSNKVYYVYVHVRNQMENGMLTGELEATLALQARLNDEGEKCDIVFASQAQMAYIQITNNVTGNDSNMDEYFKFELEIAGIGADDKFVVSGQDAEVNYGGETIATSDEYRAGESNVIYLKHGQTAIIGVSGDLYQLPINVTYAVNEVAKADYVTYADGVQRNGVSERVIAAVQDGELAAANKVAFVNHKEASVLTGITMTIVPLMTVAVVILTTYVITRKLHKKEDR